jgi:type II secretory pathway pseudopilin PulG
MHHAPRFVQHAFTMLEMVIIIALIALLIALVVPSLSGARHRAKETRALSDLRQHATIFTIYTGEWNDRFPTFADPRATQTVLRTNHGTVAFPYFASHNFWPFALSASYYQDASPSSDLFISPFAESSSYFRHYIYSCAFIARPEYWDLSTRRGRDQLGPTTLSQVRFPASKGLLSVEPWVHGANEGVPVDAPEIGSRRSLVVSVAGSARAVRIGELGPVVRSGDGTDRSLGGHSIGWLPTAAHTQHGVDGRDLPN